MQCGANMCVMNNITQRSWSWLGEVTVDRFGELAIREEVKDDSLIVRLPGDIAPDFGDPGSEGEGNEAIDFEGVGAEEDGERGGLKSSWFKPGDDSLRRNSTHRWEKDWKFMCWVQYLICTGSTMLTSVSSIVSGSEGLLPLDMRPTFPEDAPARWRPAFSLSTSPQDRMVANRLSISKRFASARGVVRNANRMFVTKRRSTLLSVWFLRRRRNASVRCSLRITAIFPSIIWYSGKREETHLHVVIFQLTVSSLWLLSLSLRFDWSLSTSLLI